jgi:urease accessory protein
MTVQYPWASRALPVLVLLMALPTVAFAHAEGGAAGAGFLTGFLHPLKGLDHVLAMLAVGMWGAQLGNPVLGSMIALDRRPPLWAAFLIVSFFAVFHGYAHGAELPGKTGAVAYSAGFVTATGLIHLTGIGIGLVVKLPHGAKLLRAGGCAIAAAGLFLAGQLLVR